MSKITWKNRRRNIRRAGSGGKGDPEYNRTAIEEADQKAYEALEKEVTILEPEDPQAWSQAMEPVYQNTAKSLDLIEKSGRYDRHIHNDRRKGRDGNRTYETARKQVRRNYTGVRN